MSKFLILERSEIGKYYNEPGYNLYIKVDKKSYPEIIDGFSEEEIIAAALNDCTILARQDTKEQLEFAYYVQKLAIAQGFEVSDTAKEMIDMIYDVADHEYSYALYNRIMNDLCGWSVQSVMATLVKIA